MWMEEETGARINTARTEQALSVSPTVISSGCPYCLTMLGDGTKAKEAEDAIGTYDVSELLAMSVFGAENKSLYRRAAGAYAGGFVFAHQPIYEGAALKFLKLRCLG